MSITLTTTDLLTTIELPNDLLWKDEFTQTAVAQHTQRSITGAFIVHESTKLQGRPMSLASDGDQTAWISRPKLLQLKALEEVTAAEYILNFRGVDYRVIFDRSSGSAINAIPIKDCVDGADNYALSLKFFTVVA